MSSPGVGSPEPAKREFSWKRLFIRSAGFGSGFAVLFVFCAFAIRWYESRPKPPKPWNQMAITARFDRAQISEEQTYQIYFVLQNTTEEDYRLEESSGTVIDAKLSKGALSYCSECIKLDYPIYIPAKQSLQISINFRYHFPKTLPKETAEERKALHKEVAAYLTSDLPGLDGFVIFDQEKRYEINLPPGWKEVK